MRALWDRLKKMLSFWPETLHATGLLLGWALITWGVARLIVWEVWLLSGGLLLLSLSGWKHMRIVFGAGLYTLSRARKGRGDG